MKRNNCWEVQACGRQSGGKNVEELGRETASHGLGDIFVFIFFGPVAVAGTHYLNTLEWSMLAAVSGLGPGLISVALLTVNNLRDIDEDRVAGKMTLPARFGRRFARLEYLA